MQRYPTDLTDSQWQVIKQYLKTKRGRSCFYRSICNAIFYLVKSGCQWRMLPRSYPKWQTVYYYFQMWQSKGWIQGLQQALSRRQRRHSGRGEQPSAAILDAQSVKSTLVSSRKHTGFDGGKKIKGIKRTLAVDSGGALLSVVVHSAGIADRKGGSVLVEKLKKQWPHVTQLFADGGYSLVGRSHENNQSLQGLALAVVKRNDLPTFKPLPKRWVVERSFAWLETNRRNAKSFERLPHTAEAIVQLSFIRLLLNRFNK